MISPAARAHVGVLADGFNFEVLCGTGWLSWHERSAMPGFRGTDDYTKSRPVRQWFARQRLIPVYLTMRPETVDNLPRTASRHVQSGRSHKNFSTT